MTRPSADPPHGLWRRIRSSIFRTPLRPRTDGERKRVVLETLFLHLRPIRVPASTLPFRHTFGLGGSGLVLFLLSAITGLLLMFVYVPSPERAYDSVVALESTVPFGGLVRGVHYWSATLFVVVAALHALRVFFTGGFRGPRQFNWVLGVGLFLFVLAANFTGYLLPWDQLSYWAVTISTGMAAYVPGAGEGLKTLLRGGSGIDAATLINFYALHTTLLPLLFAFLMALHFWRVRKAKGVVRPRGPGGEERGPAGTVLFVPNLLLREVAMALALVAVVTVLGALAGAPLGARANPGMSPDPAKAPWYFVGFQELQLHFHPVFAVLVIPLTAFVAAVLLPYLRLDSDQDGIWFRSARGRRSAGRAALAAALVTPVAVVVDESLRRGATGFWLRGVLPFAVLLTALWLLALAVRRKEGATRDEAIQAVFVACVVAFAVLTVVGMLFRGPGMALSWPGGAA